MRRYKGPHLILRRRVGRTPVWCIADHNKEWSLRLGEDQKEAADAALKAHCEAHNKTEIGKWDRAQTGLVARAQSIYFVSSNEVPDFPVKIGISDIAVTARLQGLQCACPFELEVLASMRGTAAGEAELHRRFKPSLIRGEWFRRTPELMATIERIKSAQPRSLS